MNKKAEFRFYEELNDFLPKEKQKRSFTYQFFGNPAIKDVIEACGVPHPEIEIILANGNSVGFDYKLVDGDRVAVYPVFESLDVSPVIKLREKTLRKTRFVIDVNLGKLARSLRMLGFDSLYSSEMDDLEIIEISLHESRIILTRDQNLLKHKTVTHGYWVRSTDPSKQLSEVIKRFDLISKILPFNRCMDCNGNLKAVGKNKILKNLPASTVRYYSEFYQCKSCQKIYWPGSHFQKMQRKIDRLKKELSE
jgi:uncharacterized protein with PIN domain